MVRVFPMSEKCTSKALGCFQRAPSNTASGLLPDVGQLVLRDWPLVEFLPCAVPHSM